MNKTCWNSLVYRQYVLHFLGGIFPTPTHLQVQQSSARSKLTAASIGRHNHRQVRLCSHGCLDRAKKRDRPDHPKKKGKKTGKWSERCSQMAAEGHLYQLHPSRRPRATKHQPAPAHVLTTLVGRRKTNKVVFTQTDALSKGNACCERKGCW